MSNGFEIPPLVTVESLMITDVHSITVDMTVKASIGLLLKFGISGAPVIDSVKKAISIVSQSDLMRLATTKGLTALIGSNLNLLPPSNKLITLSKGATFAELYRKFLAHPVHRIIIVDGNGRLQGLVSRSTVLKVLFGPQKTKEQDVKIKTDKKSA